MKRFIGVFAFSLLVMAALNSPVFAEDTVYLKDGSIIHGMITEEFPGKSIKIKTKDGNVFVYKTKAIERITHSAKATEVDDEAEVDPDEVSDEAPVVTPSHKKRKVVSVAAPAAQKNDPNAKFNKFGFLFNFGGWNPGVYADVNADIDLVDSSYEFYPGWVKAGMGLGWFSNNLGFKWNVQVSYQQNDYSTDWYYGSSYAGTTSTTNYLLIAGSELECDLSIDAVQNAENVTSFYVPFVLGIWAVDLSLDGYDWTSTTTSFGSGLGVRGFDSSNFLWDFQVLYRGCTRGNYLESTQGYGEIYSVNTGDYLDANVSGLDVNFTIGFLFQ